MVYAKLLKPGKFHDCKNCKTKDMPGLPGHLDGWVDKDKSFIGTVQEYPEREDAEAAIAVEYLPVERLNTKYCGQGCQVQDDQLTVFEIYYCAGCQSQYRSADQAGDCCD